MGRKAISEQERIDQINARPNIRFIRWDGEFKGNKSKAVCHCDIDGYEWSVRVDGIVSDGRGCPQCGGGIKRAPEEYIATINNLSNIKFVRWDGEYKGGKSKVICRCDIDGYEWSTNINSLVYKDTGCPQCAGNRRWTAEEYIERINARPNIRFVRWDGEFKCATSRAVCRCEIDGYEWSDSVNSLVNVGTGYPYCARYGKTEEQLAPNVTVEIPTDVKPAFDLLNW